MRYKDTGSSHEAARSKTKDSLFLTARAIDRVILIPVPWAPIPKEQCDSSDYASIAMGCTTGVKPKLRKSIVL